MQTGHPGSRRQSRDQREDHCLGRLVVLDLLEWSQGSTLHPQVKLETEVLAGPGLELRAG